MADTLSTLFRADPAADPDSSSGTSPEYDDSKPLSDLDKAALLTRVKRMYRRAQEASSYWRSEAREDYAFVAGDQWSPEDIALLKSQLRPVITFNRIQPGVDTVTGMEVSNRQMVRYVPREEGDEKVNEIATGAAEWVRENCDAEDEESDAFWDVVVSGMGWTNTGLEYRDDPDGEIIIDRVDPLEMYWDPGSRKRNLVDAGYFIRVRELTREAARMLFPDVENIDDLHAGWTSEVYMPQQPHDATEAKFYRNDQSGRTGDTNQTIRMVEMQHWEPQTFHRVANMRTGKRVFMEPEKFKMLQKAGIELPSVKQERRQWYVTFVGREVIETGPAPIKTSSTFKCMTGKRDRNRNSWYGIVRAMKDPQRWANKWLSQGLHVLNSNAKGGLFAETDAFRDTRAAEEDYSSPDKILWLNSGGLNKIRQREITELPQSFQAMTALAVEAVWQVSGLNPELQGSVNRDQPGILEYQRKQAGMNLLASLFDSLRRYRKEQGRLLYEMIQEYISDGRLVRVVGQDKAQYVPLMKQQGVLEYDIIVDDTPTSPNQKEMTWHVMQPLLPELMGLGLPLQAWKEILKVSPLPESFVEKLTAVLEQQGQNPQPTPEEKKAAAQMQIEQQKAQQQAQLAQAKAQQDAASDVRDQQLAERRAQHEAALEQQKAQMEAELQRQKFEFEMALEQRKAEAKHALEIQQANHAAMLEQHKTTHQIDMERHKVDQTTAKSNEAEAEKASKGKSYSAAMQNMDGTHKMVAELAKGHQHLQKLVEQMATKKPGTKRIAVQRGKDGRIAGAEVTEH